MATEKSSCSATCRNGVSLLTKAGKVKSRFTRQERLALMGATEKDLQTFLKIFAPRNPYYAITKAKSADPRAWTTPRRPGTQQACRLRDEDVLQHLLGATLPGRLPRWVAPRAWEATFWIGIDVDFRGDLDDFRRRCRKVRRALFRLGVSKRAWLVSRTPSGGRHYRFFLTRAIPTKDIPFVLELVGLKNVNGEIEIFPAPNKGMRLPFGHLPGQPDNPNRWVRFVRRWRKRKVPRVNWLRCLRKAEAYAASQSQVVPSPLTQVSLPKEQPLTKQTATASKKLFGIPQSQRVSRSSSPPSVPVNEYTSLLCAPWEHASQATQLWNLGIQQSGTRVQATKRLAWHLIHVRRLPASIVEKQLVDWVYQTGIQTSRQVQEDLASGKRIAEKQTREIVQWTVRQQSEGKSSRAAVLTAVELDTVVSKLKQDSSLRWEDRLEFLLRMLVFAKTYGTPCPESGWECQIAIRGVIRTWPKCSGMRYKRFMDWAIESGLLVMVREKKQTANQTGRPRTYRVMIPPEFTQSPMFTFDEAVSEAQQRADSRQNVPENTIRLQEKSDTYQDDTSPPQRTTGSATEVAALLEIKSITSVSPQNKASVSTNVNTSQYLSCQSDTKEMMNDQPATERSCSDSRKLRESPEVRTTKHQHSERSSACLAIGSPERSPVRDAVPGLPDPDSLSKLSFQHQRHRQRFRSTTSPCSAGKMRETEDPFSSLQEAYVSAQVIHRSGADLQRSTESIDFLEGRACLPRSLSFQLPDQSKGRRTLPAFSG